MRSIKPHKRNVSLQVSAPLLRYIQPANTATAPMGSLSLLILLSCLASGLLTLLSAAERPNVMIALGGIGIADEAEAIRVGATFWRTSIAELLDTFDELAERA